MSRLAVIVCLQPKTPNEEPACARVSVCVGYTGVHPTLCEISHNVQLYVMREWSPRINTINSRGEIDFNGIQRGRPSFESVYVQPSPFSYELMANYNITPNLSPHWLRVQSRRGPFGRGYDSGVIQIHNNSRGEDRRRNFPLLCIVRRRPERRPYLPKQPVRS